MKIYSSEISGSLKVRGDIFAENYVVKSTVSTITQSFSSGSTIFGDTPSDDTHQFTGSLSISGSSIKGYSSVSPTAILSNPATGSTYGLHVRGYNKGIRIDRHNSTNASTHTSIMHHSSDWTFITQNTADPVSDWDNQTTLGVAVNRIGGAYYPQNNSIDFSGYDKSFTRLGVTHLTHDSNGIEITLPANKTFKVSGSLIQFTPTEKVEITGNLEVSGEYSGNISGSSTSTGSFGRVVSAGGVFEGAGGSSLTIDSNSRIQMSKIGNNTTFGYLAGNVFDSNTTNNVAIGHEAMRFYSNSSADRNIAIGYQAMYVGGNQGDNSANNNVAIGYQAGHVMDTGTNNVIIGSNAGDALTSGAYNTLVGKNAGGSLNSGGYHVLIGSGAGASMTTNTLGSVAVGYNALASQTVKGRTVAIGVQSLTALNQTGQDDYNVAMGYRSGYTLATGLKNIFIGAFAGQETKGSQNTFVGYHAGTYAGPTSDSTYIGLFAGAYATGSQNTFVGKSAGAGGTTSAPYSSGHYNVALGFEALTAFTTGNSNVAVGYEAGEDITTGYYNTLVGYEAGENLTTGASNVFMGYEAGASKIANVGAIAIGYRAGLPSAGSYDVFIGFEAGAQTKGGGNLGIGRQAGRGSNGS